jgi:hypothetical protein
MMNMTNFKLEKLILRLVSEKKRNRETGERVEPNSCSDDH